MERYYKAPKLVPIYSHRYMPFITEDDNIPVFSIMQSDIIYYGENLISYLEVEFGFKKYNGYSSFKFPAYQFLERLIIKSIEINFCIGGIYNHYAILLIMLSKKIQPLCVLIIR